MQITKVVWSEADLKFLSANYKTLGPKKCALKLGRSSNAVKVMACYAGLTKSLKRGEQVRVEKVTRGSDTGVPIVAPLPPPVTLAVIDSGFIRAPTRAQLMGRR